MSTLSILVSFSTFDVPRFEYLELLARGLSANGQLVHHETMRSSALSHFYLGGGKLKNHVSVSSNLWCLACRCSPVHAMVADLIEG